MSLAESQQRIDKRLHEGGSLAAVEQEVIEPAPFDAEQKAVLWLYASATIPRQLAEATAEAAHEPLSRVGGMSAALRSAGSEAVTRTSGTGGLDLLRRLSRVPRRLAPKSLPLPRSEDGAAEARASQGTPKLVGAGPEDALGQRDPSFIRRTLPTFRLLSQYFRPKVRGLEHIPSEGAVLLVGNHSGGTLIADTFAFAFSFYNRFGAERSFYQLAHDLVGRLPGISPALHKYGVLSASHDHAERALDAGAAVLVYPGGDHESYRPSWESGDIDFGGRGGFIDLALKKRVPIVPVVAIGGQETALFLTRGERMAKALKLNRLLRLKVLPVQLAPPWGLTVFDLPGRLPLPSQLTIQVLPPVQLRERFGRNPDHHDVYDGLTEEMQLALDELGDERDLPVVGKVGRRSSENGVSAGGEPWEGYDRMSVPEIERRLVSQGSRKAREVCHYEQGRKRRKGVMRASTRV
jgi:1-acyl-sn-glycerol-3-phosphate acyltransferase